MLKMWKVYAIYAKSDVKSQINKRFISGVLNSIVKTMLMLITLFKLFKRIKLMPCYKNYRFLIF